MTSVLARLGQWEARTAIQTVWRPKKRKREDWVCRQCHARGLQRREYSDDTVRTTVGDYLFPPSDRESGSGSEKLKISQEWHGRRRGFPQVTHRDTLSAESNGSRFARSSLNGPGRVDEDEWRTRDTANVDPSAVHESAQNVLWEGFEQQADVEDEGLAELDDSRQVHVGRVEYATEDRERDEALLNIDYVATLPQALDRHEPDLTARCLYAAAKADDLEYIRNLAEAVFSEILNILEPGNFLDRLASANIELSEATRKLIGVAPMQRVAHEYSQLVTEVVAMRRSGCVRLTLADYTVLLRGARDLGNWRLAEALWKKMHHDLCVPSTECYNHYMSCKIFNRLHSGRDRLRVIPFNMLARKAANPGAVYQGYRIGRGGLKDQVMTIFRDMLKTGAVADETSFRTVIMAAAREGELPTVKSVLRKVWSIDVDALLAGHPEAEIAPKQFSQDSPLVPTEKLLFTIAHAFAINNDIPTALRLVDFVARYYDLTISQETWAQLFEWTFVLAVPRTGVKAATDGSRTGKLPLQSVMSLWNTMTGAPYFIDPTMGMYNLLIKNLFYRDMSFAMVEKMKEGYHRGQEHRKTALTLQKALQAAIERSKHGHPDEQSLEQLRRDWEYAEIIRKRNQFWLKRWLRLLLGSLRTTSTLPSADQMTQRDIPLLLSSWRHLAPRTIRYNTATGKVEFDIRSQADIDQNNVGGLRHMAMKEELSRRAPRYVGDTWARSWRSTSSTPASIDQGKPLVHAGAHGNPPAGKVAKPSAEQSDMDPDAMQELKNAMRAAMDSR
ncbi:hypothetical protein LTR97_006279 [Elasticomyces elasticus]|uniref:Pentatricopeptide repeat domain-containing protein n=1 Tax=Elasticomyces elasticus TaxID=574655 RepID=A0AAN7W9G7_9PEZI|nr:hypothetical protein LTR97_006279 [Elasticomyces elasticus]